MTTTTKTNRVGYTRGQWLLLAVLAAITVAVYGTLAVVIVEEKLGSAAALQVTTAGSRLTLNRARSVATALATDLQSDAYMVGAATTWRLAAGDRLTLYRPAWSFQFYSPSARQLWVVSVDADGGRVERLITTHAPPQRVDADWSLGAGDLLLIWMAHGGEEFIRQNAHVNIHCQLVREGGRSVWRMIALDPGTRQTLVVRIDAHTRQVLNR